MAQNNFYYFIVIFLLLHLKIIKEGRREFVRPFFRAICPSMCEYNSKHIFIVNGCILMVRHLPMLPWWIRIREAGRRAFASAASSWATCGRYGRGGCAASAARRRRRCPDRWPAHPSCRPPSVANKKIIALLAEASGTGRILGVDSTRWDWGSQLVGHHHHRGRFRGIIMRFPGVSRKIESVLKLCDIWFFVRKLGPELKWIWTIWK